MEKPERFLMRYSKNRIKEEKGRICYSLLWLIMLTALSSCEINKVNKRTAEKYCGTCHLVPNPQLLPKAVWENNILPTMADYFRWVKPSGYNYANVSIMQKKGFTSMTDEEWAKIIDYYVGNGPDSLEVIVSNDLEVQRFFNVHEIKDICQAPAVTSIGPHGDSTFLISCENSIHLITKDGELVESWNVDDIVTQMTANQNGLIEYLDVGLLDPHDVPLGSLKILNESTGQVSIIIDSLYRPVDYSIMESSFIISEFGNNLGRLSVHNRDDNWSTISNMPGSYRQAILDIDGDGIDELLFMSAQAFEGIYVSEFKGGQWQSPEPRLMFGSVHGLSDMDVQDVNDDGFPDLVLANGDNADYSITLKNYHGARIYLNDGSGHFNEVYFYPQYGSTQVKWIDVNNDKKLDIIVSSYFPDDYNSAITILVNSSINYAEEIEFIPYKLSQSISGRWMVMEDFDADDDGDIDILLGSFIIGPTNVSEEQFDKWVSDGPDVLLLENLSIK